MIEPLLNKIVISVVIPVYNEGDHLKIVVEKIQCILKALSKSNELILIDDGSTDNSWAIIGEVSKKYPIVRGVRLSRHFGKESAICAGLEMARGDAVIVMDGDLQHPPEIIMEMVRLWSESHADVVEAVKVNRGRESLINKMGARGFYAILSKLSGLNLNGASDYKLLDRKVVSAWMKMGERNLFFRGMITWLGFKVHKIPFSVEERVGGQSRWSTIFLARLAINAVTSFSSLPLHIITFMGGIFIVLSIILALQTLYLKATGAAVSGFTTVIILLLFIGSLLMISLGIIGEYMARIYEEVKVRPRYIVDQKIDKQLNNMSLKDDYDEP